MLLILEQILFTTANRQSKLPRNPVLNPLQSLLLNLLLNLL
jgi:hypothetical protein